MCIYIYMYVYICKSYGLLVLLSCSCWAQSLVGNCRFAHQGCFFCSFSSDHVRGSSISGDNNIYLIYHIRLYQLIVSIIIPACY